MTMRDLLLRGMLVGACAAIVAFGVAQALGENPIGEAIQFESTSEAHTHAGQADRAGSAHEEEAPVSRSTQSGVGLFVGLLAFGVAIGGLFALAYGSVQGRMGNLGARSTAALVALGGFVGVCLLPELKYPANPPAVGDPDTIGDRTALYFTMIAISLVVVISVPLIARRLAPSVGGWNAGLLGGAVGLVSIALAYALMPSAGGTPADFPADVLWDFRIASIAIQASVWLTIGVLFGLLTQRRLQAAGMASG